MQFVWIIIPIQVPALVPQFLTLSFSFCYTLSQSATSLGLSQSVNITLLNSFPMYCLQPEQPSSYEYVSQYIYFLCQDNHST